MKFSISLIALIATTAFATELPSGAHDTRPSQPRPNVCDDKCDVSFLKHYEGCEDKPEPDCVAMARKQTCKADYSCSSSCGYTAEGCANPAVWKPSEVASAGSSTAITTSCSKKIMPTSVVTVTSMIQRPKLNIGHMGLIAAEMPTTVDGGIGAPAVSTLSSTHNHAAMLSSEAAVVTDFHSHDHSTIASTPALASVIGSVVTEALTPSYFTTTSKAATTAKNELLVDPNGLISDHIPTTLLDTSSHTSTRGPFTGTAMNPSLSAAAASIFGGRATSVGTSVEVGSVSMSVSSMRGQWTTSFATTLPDGRVTSITSPVKPTSDIDATPSATSHPHHGGARKVKASALALIVALVVAVVL